MKNTLLPHPLPLILPLLLSLFLPLSLEAQTPCNDTIVRIYDTLCTGDTLHWAGQTITYNGAYYDTVPRANSSGCDSVTIRHVSFFNHILVTLEAIPVCHGVTGYHLYAYTDGQYLQWQSEPPDSTLQLDDPPIHAFTNPQVPTRYTVDADHYPPPRCPGHSYLQLNPVQPVTVRLDVSPHTLDYDQPHLHLRDLSTGNRETPYGGWAGRNWYINGERLTSQQPDIHHTVGIPAPDSLRILMETFTPTCIDTAQITIPFIKDQVLIPNIFTPDADDNRTFLPRVQQPSEYQLSIFNRQGQSVFRSTDPLQPWDGTSQGRPCPQGIYTYHLRYSHTHTPAQYQNRTGTVTLLR